MQATSLPTARSSQDASVIQQGQTVSIRYSRLLPRFSSDRVWSALTEPDEVEGWLGKLDIVLYQGGPFKLTWLNTNQNEDTFEMKGLVTSLLPYRELAMDSDLYGELRWDLKDVDEGCLLTFTKTRVPLGVDLLLGLAGWHTHLDLLESTLEGNPTDWDNWPVELWQAHYDRYKMLQAQGLLEDSLKI